MKAVRNQLEKMMIKIAEKSLHLNANSTTCAIFYQPKIPGNLHLNKKKKK